MTTTDETFQQTVLALRDWLNFLEEKKDETARQLERARRNVDKGVAPVNVATVDAEEPKVGEEYEELKVEKKRIAPEMEAWL